MIENTNTGGANPRQALALALVDAICAKRDGRQRSGGFAVMTMETPALELLCGHLGAGLPEGQGLLVATYASPTTQTCDSLVLIQRLGNVVRAEAVHPYWPVGQLRASLVTRDRGEPKAFHIDDEDFLREGPAPQLGVVVMALADSWSRIVKRTVAGAVNPADWQVAFLAMQ